LKRFVPDIFLRTDYYSNSENHPTKRSEPYSVSGVDDKRWQKVQSNKQHACSEGEQG
jgi:hypothetical protein